MSLRTQVGFRRLLVGQGASALGDWMGTFALMALVDHLSDSAAAVGGILAFRLIPAALGGTLAAKLVNRWDRRRTMITMDLLRAGMIAVVPLRARAVVGVLVGVRTGGPQRGVPGLSRLLRPRSGGRVRPAAGQRSHDGIVVRQHPDWRGPVRRVRRASTRRWLAGIRTPYALVFWIDALTFGVSAFFIARALGGLQSREPSPQAIPDRAAISDSEISISPSRLRDAWSVPLVRRVLPATAAAAVGLGALFSLGIKLVQEELEASDIEYGVLIVLFGAGAGIGLALTHRSRHVDLLVLTRRGALAMGALVALMSQSPTVWLTFLGAAGFGAGATVALTSGMSALQAQIPREEERVLAFSAFHVVIRIGLGAAALGAGAIGDGLNGAGLPGTRSVLLASGLLVLASAATVRPILDVDVEKARE